jgi:hypothetical protein
MFDTISEHFTKVFSFLYVYVDTPLVTYIIFLSLLLGLTKLIYNIKNYFPGGTSGSTILLKTIWASILTVLVSFDLWFIFFHFQSFRVLN